MECSLGMRAGLLAVPLILTVAVAVGAPPDPRLADAVARQDGRAVRDLLGHGVDVNGRLADGTTALHWAAHWNDAELADQLVKAGANVNAADEHGVTPLALACVNVSERMVNTLLNAGANPNTPRTSGMTPLFDAVDVGSVALVNALLAHRADVNAATIKTRITPTGLEILKKLDGPVDELHKKQFRHLPVSKLKALAEAIEEAFPAVAPQ